MSKRKQKANGQISLLGAVLTERPNPPARWQFLQVMDRILPWAEMLAQVERIYPKPGNGRPPYPMEPLFRLFLVASWFGLSDKAAEEIALRIPAQRDRRFRLIVTAHSGRT